MGEEKYEITEAEAMELEKRFTYHAPKEDQRGRYVVIRDEAARLARFLMGSCPRSRELSLALTNLEQSVMWANASIARNE